MSNWNFDVTQAPRGRDVTKTKTIGGKEVEYTVFERDPIFVATKCGKVTTSYWIPKESRWCMLAEGEEPVAWLPWPEYPSRSEDSAEGS